MRFSGTMRTESSYEGRREPQRCLVTAADSLKLRARAMSSGVGSPTMSKNVGVMPSTSTVSDSLAPARATSTPFDEVVDGIAAEVVGAEGDEFFVVAAELRRGWLCSPRRGAQLPW